MFSAIVQLLTTTLDFMATLGMQVWVPAIGILNIHIRSFEEKGVFRKIIWAAGGQLGAKCFNLKLVESCAGKFLA